MVFKRGVALLAIAAAAAVASADPISVHSDLKHPVVKDVKAEDGKVLLTLQEGAPAHKKTAHHKEHHEAKKEKKEEKKPARKQAKKEVKKQEKKEVKKQAKKAVKKPAQKQVSVEKKADGEVVRKYAHGEVRVNAKNQPAAKKDVHHKTHSHAKKPVEKAGAVDEKNVDLKEGEEVSIEFGGHDVSLELLKNGSLRLTADDETYVLPGGSDTISVDLYESSDSGSSDDEVSSGSGDDSVGDDEEEEDEEASSVAKKFTELATKLTGNGKFIPAQAAPFVFVGGVIGALAAVVGIAAIAINRARDNAAAADPQSVLVNATEDVEADVEAGSTEESSEDAAADETQSLSGSESESDEEEDQEEGKFTNEVASV